MFSNLKEGLKQKLVRVLEENLILSEKVQRLEEGATTSIVSGHPSHTYGKFRKAMYGAFQDNILFIDDPFNKLHHPELTWLPKWKQSFCLRVVMQVS